MAKRPKIKPVLSTPAPYALDTPICFHVEMNMQGANVTETLTLGEIVDITAEDLATIEHEAVEELIQGAFEEWMANEVAAGWSRVET